MMSLIAKIFALYVMLLGCGFITLMAVQDCISRVRDIKEELRREDD